MYDVLESLVVDVGCVFWFLFNVDVVYVVWLLFVCYVVLFSVILVWWNYWVESGVIGLVELEL